MVQKFENKSSKSSIVRKFENKCSKVRKTKEQKVREI
nr:MAG TPA: hypothetical protein [Caudoviricetes sp.]